MLGTSLKIKWAHWVSMLRLEAPAHPFPVVRSKG